MLTSFQVNAQYLIQKSGRSIPESVRITLATRIAVVDYQAINIDLNQTSKNMVSLSFFNHQITLLKQRVETRNQDDFSWFASDGLKMNQGILTIKEGDIQGIITVNTEIYRIETFENLHIITKIDQSKYPPEGCSVHVDQQEEQQDSIPNYRQPKEDDNKPQPPANKMHKTYPAQQFWNYECKLRVLVLYTTAAKNAYNGNIENHVRLAIDEMNQSFVNSDVNFQVELVYQEETGYQERNWKDDIQDFQANGDGHLDNVHSLREKYSADVCVLIMNDGSLCGVARGIKTCSTHGFCTVYWDCATGNYTFAHEIAHLIGCQHHTNDIRNADASNAYPYAHGYKSTGNDWRTIMSYSCPGGCTRLLYWSNPNKTWNGQVMGTIQTNDNARMLNTYIPNVMSHRPASGSRVVIQADIDPTSYGVVYHANKIETTGTVNIPNAYGWGFIAVNEVTLNPGFETADGSVFEAKIIDACGLADGEQCNYAISFDSNNKDMLLPSQISLKIFPNPVNNLYFSVESNSDADYCIFNSIGVIIKRGHIQKGMTDIVLPQVNPGIYFINCIFDGVNIRTNKLIVP